MAIDLTAVLRLKDKFSDKISKASKSLDKLKSSADKIEKPLRKVDKAFNIMGGAAIAGATVAGTALLKVGDSHREATRIIQTGTGASGDALDELMDSYSQIGRRVPNDLAEVANALTNLNTMTGESGKVLEDLTTNVLDVSRLLGEDGVANAEAFGQALNQFNRPAAEGIDLLDGMYKVTQEYGIGLNELNNQLTGYGSVLRNAGFSMEESADLFGRLHKEGLSVSRIMPGLNKAFRDWASAGKDPRAELEKLIAELSTAEEGTEAFAKAVEIFGAEGVNRLKVAIDNGVFSMEDLGDIFDDTTGLISDSARESMSFGELFSLAMNNANLALQPLGGLIYDIASDYFPDLQNASQELADRINDNLPEIRERFQEFAERASEVITTVVDKAREFANFITNNWGAIKGTLIALATGFVLVKGTLVALTIIQTISKMWSGLNKVIKLVRSSQLLLNAAMLANPIGLIIAGIVALIAAGVWLYKNWDTVKEKLSALWDGVKEIFGKITDWIGEKLTQIVDWFKEKFEQAKNFVIWYFTEYPYIVAEKMGELVGHAVNWLSQLPSRFREFFSSAYNTAVNWLSRLPGRAAEFLSEMVNRAKTRLSEFASNMKEWIQTAYDNAVNIVKELPGKIAGFIAEIPGRVRGFIGDVWGAFKEIGSAIPRAIADGFNAALGAVSGAAKWAIDKVTSGLGGLRDLGGQVASSFASGYDSATDGSHYHGLDYVPRDGYRANLHRGEMVLPRQEAQAYREGRSGGGTSVNIHIARMEVRNEADIQRIGDALADRIESRLNRGTA